MNDCDLSFSCSFFFFFAISEEIVSVAALQVFGKHAAELPLATTSKLWRQQVFFCFLNFICHYEANGSFIAYCCGSLHCTKRIIFFWAGLLPDASFFGRRTTMSFASEAACISRA